MNEQFFREKYHETQASLAASEKRVEELEGALREFCHGEDYGGHEVHCHIEELVGPGNDLQPGCTCYLRPLEAILAPNVVPSPTEEPGG